MALLNVNVVVCKINVHKRCEKNVANDCGIDKKSMAQIMKELGISGDKLSTKRKKVSTLADIFADRPDLICIL